MSEVTPSDGGYYYNSKSLDDLEDEVKSEAKRAETKRKEAEETREKKEGEALRKKDRDVQETVDSVREKSADAYVRDRDRSREEIGKAKAESYDRFGRFNEANSEYKQQADRLKDAQEALRREINLKIAKSDEYHDKRTEQLQHEAKENLAQGIRDARDSAQAAYEAKAKNDKFAYKGGREEGRALYDKRDRERTKEFAETEAHLQDELRKQQEGFRYSTDRVKHAAEDEVKNAYERAGERSEKDAVALKKSHDEQTGDLREELRRLIHEEGNYQKEKGQARLEAVREHEDEFRTFHRLLDEHNTGEAADLKRHLNEQAKAYNARNTEMAESKDAFYTKEMARQRGEFRTDAKDAQTAFMRDHANLENRLTLEQDRADTTLENAIETTNKRNAESLAAQADTANEGMKRQRLSDNDKLERVQGELNRKIQARTAADISPAAEERSRQLFLKEYAKTNDADRRRNADLVDGLQHNSRERYVALLDDKERTETELHQQATYQHDQDQSALANGLVEAQADKESALRSSEHAHQSETENLSHAHANTLEHQRRDYEQMISDLRDDALAKQSSLREDANFNSRMATRAFSTRQNEIIREYEKKLADQKADYDSQIDDLKTTTQQALHEKDRSVRQSLEEQSRSYEQRMAQAEAQHKERERLITDNYSDELEKVKRSNALLIQKKS